MGRQPFRPSRHGCTFSNADLLGRRITVAGIRVGSVTDGLCGGMVLAALRAWQRSAPPPGQDPATMRGILLAQVRSLDLPRGPVRYLRLQQPGAGRQRAASTDRTVAELRSALLRDHCPVPLGLVCALGRGSSTLVKHHVVLAYDVLDDGPDGLRVCIYDPNYPGNDTITLLLSPLRCQHSRGRSVYSAFPLPVR